MPKPVEPKPCGDPSLKDIQAWLHTFVVSPGNSDEAIATAERKAGFTDGSAEALILPSPTLEPRERIQIYRGMYLLRMLEALEIDFPAVAEFLGEAAFKSVVADYVDKRPSQSYTLDHLGRQFAAHLKEVDCAGSGRFLGDLARLEWSLCMVAIAHDSPTLAMTDLAVVPPEEFTQIILQPIPAFQLLSFEHNTNVAYKAWSADDDWPQVETVMSHLATWRHELKVWRMDLSDAAHFFLTQLLEGRCLGEALDATIDGHSIEEETAFEWFQNWVSEGFFASFEHQTS